VEARLQRSVSTLGLPVSGTPKHPGGPIGKRAGPERPHRDGPAPSKTKHSHHSSKREGRSPYLEPYSPRTPALTSTGDHILPAAAVAYTLAVEKGRVVPMRRMRYTTILPALLMTACAS
jgi:hypothetical protein